MPPKKAVAFLSCGGRAGDPAGVAARGRSRVMQAGGQGAPQTLQLPHPCSSQAAAITGAPWPRPPSLTLQDRPRSHPECQTAPPEEVAAGAGGGCGQSGHPPLPHLHPEALKPRQGSVGAGVKWQIWGNKLPSPSREHLTPPTLSRPPGPGQGLGVMRGVTTSQAPATQQDSGGRVPSWRWRPLAHSHGHVCTHRSTPRGPPLRVLPPGLSGKYLETRAHTPAPGRPPGQRGLGQGAPDKWERPSEPQKAVKTPTLRGVSRAHGPRLVPARPDLQSQGRDEGHRGTQRGLTSAGQERCTRGKSRGRLDICQGENTSARPGRRRAGEAAGAPLCMLPGADGHLPVT